MTNLDKVIKTVEDARDPAAMLEVSLPVEYWAVILAALDHTIGDLPLAARMTRLVRNALADALGIEPIL